MLNKMLSVKQYNLLNDLCKKYMDKDETMDANIGHTALLMVDMIVEKFHDKRVSYGFIVGIINEMIAANNFNKTKIKIYQEVTFALTVTALTADKGFEIVYDTFPSIKMIYNDDRFCQMVKRWNPSSQIRYFKTDHAAIKYAKNVYPKWKPICEYNKRNIPRLTGYISVHLVNLGNVYMANSLAAGYMEHTTKRKFGTSVDYWNSQRHAYIKFLTDRGLPLTPEQLVRNMLHYGWRPPSLMPVNVICDFIKNAGISGRVLDLSGHLPAVIIAALVTGCNEVSYADSKCDTDAISRLKRLYPAFKLSGVISGNYDVAILNYDEMGKHRCYREWKRAVFMPDIKRIKNCKKIIIFANDGYGAKPNKQFVHHIWEYFAKCPRKIFGIILPKILRTREGGQTQCFKNITTGMVIENKH